MLGGHLDPGRRGLHQLFDPGLEQGIVGKHETPHGGFLPPPCGQQIAKEYVGHSSGPQAGLLFYTYFRGPCFTGMCFFPGNRHPRLKRRTLSRKILNPYRRLSSPRRRQNRRDSSVLDRFGRRPRGREAFARLVTASCRGREAFPSPVGASCRGTKPSRGLSGPRALGTKPSQGLSRPCAVGTKPSRALSGLRAMGVKPSRARSGLRAATICGR